MDIDTKLDAILLDARASLAALETSDRSVAGTVERVAALRYAEGMLIGFLEALVIVDPAAARGVAPKIEGFISEAIAARLLLE